MVEKDPGHRRKKPLTKIPLSEKTLDIIDLFLIGNRSR